LHVYIILLLCNETRATIDFARHVAGDFDSGASRVETANAHYSRTRGVRALRLGRREERARRAEKKAKGGTRESILGSAGAVVPKQTVDGAAERA
jgi:hypothetical protein